MLLFCVHFVVNNRNYKYKYTIIQNSYILWRGLSHTLILRGLWVFLLYNQLNVTGAYHNISPILSYSWCHSFSMLLCLHSSGGTISFSSIAGFFWLSNLEAVMIAYRKKRKLWLQYINSLYLLSGIEVESKYLYISREGLWSMASSDSSHANKLRPTLHTGSMARL